LRKDIPGLQVYKPFMIVKIILLDHSNFNIIGLCQTWLFVGTPKKTWSSGSVKQNLCGLYDYRYSESKSSILNKIINFSCFDFNLESHSFNYASILLLRSAQQEKESINADDVSALLWETILKFPPRIQDR